MAAFDQGDSLIFKAGSLRLSMAFLEPKKSIFWVMPGVSPLSE